MHLLKSKYCLDLPLRVSLLIFKKSITIFWGVCVFFLLMIFLLLVLINVLLVQFNSFYRCSMSLGKHFVETVRCNYNLEIACWIPPTFLLL